MALFPGYFANVYGSTEALMVTCCDYRRHPDKLGSVGKASIGMEVRVIRANGRDPDDLCKPGEIGQLITRGPSLMTEYSVFPIAPPPRFRAAGSFPAMPQCSEDEGFITVMGRMDHTIKSGGENIHPSEVEDALFDTPASLTPRSSGCRAACGAK